MTKPGNPELSEIHLKRCGTSEAAPIITIFTKFGFQGKTDKAVRVNGSETLQSIIY